MAESKSTLIKPSWNSSSPAVLKWSSLASADNNVYFDVNHVDASKMIILIANQASSEITATCGKFYVGASDSAATGSTHRYPYSASKLYRMELRSTRVAAGAMAASTKGRLIYALGPFETARFKSSQGYIKVSKRRSAGDAGEWQAAAILIP